MFVSFQHINIDYQLQYKNKDYVYRIIDTDFEEIARGSTVEAAIIDVYENRSLNVAANLIQAFCLKQLIQYNKVNTPKFAKYEKDLEKYLILL